MNEEPAILDVGMGMNPKLVGRENGTRFGETVLEYLAVQHPGVTLRAVVQSWNERSLRLTRRLGFQDTGELTVIQSDRPVTYRVVRRPSHRDSALAVVNHVADRIMRIPQTSPRVAIDGPDGAGKTHFADQLAVVLLNRHHRPVVRISIDGFHNLRAVRYRQGRDSPLGFWADSYNYDRFRRDVLEPFATGGSRRFRRASYSHATDEILHPEPEIADPASVLVVDGIFLQRVELSAQWDLTVFLDVAFTETAKRMALRDGTPPDPEHPRMRRYVDGQREYFRQCHPRQRTS